MTTHSTIATRIAALVASTLLTACASLVQAEPTAGYIAEVGTSQVRLCFRSGVSPSPGQEVSFIANANTPRPSYKSLRPVGRARISAVGSDGCATAIVLDGKPHQDDEVHLSSLRAERESAMQ